MKESKKIYEENRKNLMNETKETLRNWMSKKDSSFSKIEIELQDMIKLIVGKSGAKLGSINQNDIIRNDFIKNSSLTSLELFENYEMGKVGMVSFIKSQLSKKDSSQYLWINYDEKTKTYSLIGQGPEVPEEYTGWVPTEMREVEL